MLGMLLICVYALQNPMHDASKENNKYHNKGDVILALKH